MFGLIEMLASILVADAIAPIGVRFSLVSNYTLSGPPQIVGAAPEQAANRA